MFVFGPTVGALFTFQIGPQDKSLLMSLLPLLFPWSVKVMWSWFMINISKGDVQARPVVLVPCEVLRRPPGLSSWLHLAQSALSPGESLIEQSRQSSWVNNQAQPSGHTNKVVIKFSGTAELSPKYKPSPRTSLGLDWTLLKPPDDVKIFPIFQCPANYQQGSSPPSSYKQICYNNVSRALCHALLNSNLIYSLCCYPVHDNYGNIHFYAQ